MILVKVLVWIDQIIDNDENKGYIEIMKKEFNIDCIQFKSVESGLQYNEFIKISSNSFNGFWKTFFIICKSIR